LDTDYDEIENESVDMQSAVVIPNNNSINPQS
jgi:hypothetical protein